MSKKCPKCGSIRIVEAPRGDVSICLACESFLNTINGKSKPTVFDHITESVETLAKKLVYCKHVQKIIGEMGYSYVTFASTIIKNEEFETKPEALAATVEELKKEYKEQSR